MKSIKSYLKQWRGQRLFRLAIGLLLSVVYLLNGQNIYLAFAVFFFIQAIFNIGCCGCATGRSCEIRPQEDKKTYVETEKIDKNNE